MRTLAISLAVFLLGAFAFAQSTDPTGGNPPPVHTGKLLAGKTIRDSKGREVTNNGLNNNGALHLRYTGKLTRDSLGNLTCSGEISSVTNPASQGSEGPITIDTGGESTDIDLGRNGTDPGGHVGTTIVGGKANVNVGGNFNDVSVGGSNNTITFGGNNNLGTGLTGSGGGVILGGHGNSWGGTGSWVVRN